MRGILEFVWSKALTRIRLAEVNTERLEVIANRIFTYAIVGVLVAEGVVIVIAMLWGFGYLG